MDIPTTIEVIGNMSKLKRDGSHMFYEHLLDGISVIILEEFGIYQVPVPEEKNVGLET